MPRCPSPLPLICLLLTACAPAQETPRLAELGIESQRMRVEIAASHDARQTGLMHREHLPPAQGMLFVYPESGLLCMWMKNTRIPLSVAFIDEAGRILNIEDMQPDTRDHHCSVAPARYALETHLGWFREHGIGSGDAVTGLAGLEARE